MRILTLCLAAVALVLPSFAEPLTFQIHNAPASGLVVSRVNLTGMVPQEALNAKGLALTGVMAGTHDIKMQFVPDDDFDAVKNAAGSVIALLPGSGDYEVIVYTEPGPAWKPLQPGGMTGGNTYFGFDFPQKAGLPSKFTFPKSGKVFQSFMWNDRIYDNERHEQFCLRDDKNARSDVLQGPLCMVVRVAASYCAPDGTSPPSHPTAIYDWYIIPSTPLLYVSTRVRQADTFVWDELHILELIYPDGGFGDWAAGEPLKKGTFSGSKESVIGGNWGALIDGENVIGMFGGKKTIHDGKGGYGMYLNAVWEPWRDRERRYETRVWLTTQADPAESVAKATNQFGSLAKVTVLPVSLRDKLDALRADANQVSWRVALAQTLASEGDIAGANTLADGKEVKSLKQFSAGDMGIAVRLLEHGAAVQSIFDLKKGTELCVPARSTLFQIHFRGKQENNKKDLVSSEGWGKVTSEGIGHQHVLIFADPLDKDLAGVSVKVRCAACAWQDRVEWTIEVENTNPDWGLWDVVFPQVAVANLGDATRALYPLGPGQLKQDLWSQSFSYDGRYPSGWCVMPLLAVYDESAGTGLYCAIHDENAATKEVAIASDPAAQCVTMSFTEYAEDAGVPAKAHKSQGTAVWQLLRGDWYDAAMVYKQWAREHVKWWPKLGKDGREDTALWMRELCAWANTGGDPADCVARVKEFQQFLGVPCGFHWYNWHQIPFDNDYPHYFPPKDGFADAVKDLREHDIFVMPYINGRLWDTRDKGAEDFEFTSRALPAVSKQPDGKPYTEVYGSKEADGSPVRLGVMCPTTPLWQATVKDIVLRLQNECGTPGVYIDQIAAAAPTLCMDKTHGHPLGGGHWWTDGYWRLLDGIRKEMKSDRMITTECNAEPYVRWMDGYLTWHWQYDGAVPAFPAVYGGTLQMFGRSYGAGPTKDLAMRMRAAQQLVFGEQIGWIDPKMLAECESKDFFRQAVRMRHKLRRFFYAGEMARPPQLKTDAAKVKADWQWGGEMWVTTDAVLTGAWRLPHEGKTALLFANVSDDAVTGEVSGNIDGRVSERTVRACDPENDIESFTLPPAFTRSITVPARKVVAWVVEDK